ncbi:hypothetical protein [Blastopirellula retiformator]|uniref:Uncharacterized protein n=1 Tax=Blastopirellula retiformator TaxID=2527970 RepID=A0A5C5V7Q5_9BACT|nr:hypothetical protein [Blastopirellula retiformator]TWT34598.1 hypothetical protein Enr8_20110 [Blastopirellula retiformator]
MELKDEPPNAAPPTGAWKFSLFDLLLFMTSVAAAVATAGYVAGLAYLLLTGIVGSFLAAFDVLSRLDQWINREAEPILHASLSRLAALLIGCAFGSIVAAIVCVVLVLSGLQSLDHTAYVVTTASLVGGATSASFPSVGRRLSGVTGLLYTALFSLGS